MSALPQLLTRADLPSDAITVSPSQLSLWYTCEWKWFLIKRQDREPFSMYSRPMDLGTMMHKFQEKWYGMFLGRPIERISSEQVLALLQEIEEENNWKDYESQLKLMTVFNVFLSYVDKAVKRETLIPLGVEVETFAPTGLTSLDGRPIYLHGIIDLVAEDDKGRTGVVDHKSHTSRPWKTEEVAFDIQIFFYMLLLRLQDVYVEFGAINAINLFIPAEPKNGHTDKSRARLQDTLTDPSRFQRFILSHSEYELSVYQKKIYSVIRKMWGTPDYEFDMRITRDCARCGFREPCTELLHGGEIVHLLNSKFTKPQIAKVVDFNGTDLLLDESAPVLPG